MSAVPPLASGRKIQTALAPTDQEFDITAARAWTPADFRDGTLAVYLGSHAPDAPFEGHWDATSIRITYAMPPVDELHRHAGGDRSARRRDLRRHRRQRRHLAATEAEDVAAFVGELVTDGTLVGIEAADVARYGPAPSPATASLPPSKRATSPPSPAPPRPAWRAGGNGSRRIAPPSSAGSSPPVRSPHRKARTPPRLPAA